MLSLILLTFCVELVLSASISPPFPHNAINATIASWRKLECNVDVIFRQEGPSIQILCGLEDVMSWLDTWFKPLLVVLIIFMILIVTALVLCCIRMSKLNLDSCGISKRIGCKETENSVENSKTIPFLRNPKVT
ncbi:hypothetical protein Ocin01_14908 [Orchesella cincta]|uniref:Uncharacterized protein n=1 Tax=Orchesella cincta TaxID=48709 RepID=A0A1D2MFX3_ORCCI|nr:hypothetical protein Ocin01_14908 [Orchesella cincta]